MSKRNPPRSWSSIVIISGEIWVCVNEKQTHFCLNRTLILKFTALFKEPNTSLTQWTRNVFGLLLNCNKMPTVKKYMVWYDKTEIAELQSFLEIASEKLFCFNCTKPAHEKYWKPLELNEVWIQCIQSFVRTVWKCFSVSWPWSYLKHENESQDIITKTQTYSQFDWQTFQFLYPTAQEEGTKISSRVHTPILAFAHDSIA